MNWCYLLDVKSCNAAYPLMSLTRIYIYPVPFQNSFLNIKLHQAKCYTFCDWKMVCSAASFVKLIWVLLLTGPRQAWEQDCTLETRALYPFSHLILSSVTLLILIDGLYLPSKYLNSNLQWFNSGTYSNIITTCLGAEFICLYRLH